METIQELVHSIKQREGLIKKEHLKIRKFRKENPDVFDSLWIDFESQMDNFSPQETQLAFLTANSMLKFNEAWLLNNYTKVYKQLTDPKSLYASTQQIYYYDVDIAFYQHQRAKGYKLGDLDDKGYVVTGSNLIITSNALDKSAFLHFYYSTNN